MIAAWRSPAAATLITTPPFAGTFGITVSTDAEGSAAGLAVLEGGGVGIVGGVGVAFTVIVTVPCAGPLAAVNVTEPALSAVTVPSATIDATAGAEFPHATDASVSTRPSASLTTVVNLVVCPTVIVGTLAITMLAGRLETSAAAVNESKGTEQSVLVTRARTRIMDKEIRVSCRMGEAPEEGFVRRPDWRSDVLP